jgi:hypothetical protein
VSAVVAGVEVPDSIVRWIFEGGHLSVVLAPADGEVPASMREWFGTRAVDGDEDRHGRCYELSAVAMVSPLLPKGSTLVHGSIHGPDEDHERIAHAWVKVRPDLVWEPFTGMLYDRVEWYLWASARDEVEYSRADVLRLCRLADHTGPWRDTRYPTAQDIEREG